MAKGSSETTTSRKMIVKAAIRIFSAISLGVFWRLAPSTSAIMRSRKVSPGLALICTTILSESTRVPPVTADLSPPLSRRPEGRGWLGEEEAHELDGGDHAADLTHEHHRVLELHARVELLERRRDRGTDDLGIPDRDVPLAPRLPLFDF